MHRSDVHLRGAQGFRDELPASDVLEVAGAFLEDTRGAQGRGIMQYHRGKTLLEPHHAAESRITIQAACSFLAF